MCIHISTACVEDEFAETTGKGTRMLNPNHTETKARLLLPIYCLPVS